MLVIAGGLVTSTGSGLAVPDWPLSYGTLFPPMVGGIRFEHSHRMIAATVGLLMIVLAVWLQRAEPRRWVRRLGWAALAAIVTQGVLGGLTVLYQLPVPASVAHACLGQTFFCLVVALALVTSGGWEKQGRETTGSLRQGSLSPKGTDPIGMVRGETGRMGSVADRKLQRLAWLTFGFAYLQLILGAVLRHTGAPLALGLHVAGAVLVAVHAVLLLARTLVTSPAWDVQGQRTGDRGRGNVGHLSSVICHLKLQRLATLLVTLIGVQLLLGVGAYVVQWATPQPMPPSLETVLVATAHVAVGALVLASALAVAMLAPSGVKCEG